MVDQPPAEKQQPSEAEPSSKTTQPVPQGPSQFTGWVWVTLVLLLATVLLFSNLQVRREVPTWQQFHGMLQDEAVEPNSVQLQNDRIVATLKADYETDAVDKPSGEAARVFVAIDAENRDFYLQQLNELGVRWKDATGASLWSALAMWFPLLLFVGLILWFVFRARQVASNGPAGMLGQFGRSQHRSVSREDVDVKLDDVAGVEEAKAEIQELIRFLTDAEKFRQVGARVPRGVLIQGPPGCGKTLLARAIAGEADVPFFSISGSDFMEMFVGVGARRVRDLFQQAKQHTPSMIFLDEIDAVGRKRGRQSMPGGGHGEQEQTLNAILAEMDGFEPHEEVIVIAATNRPDVLDQALTRRGRFDRNVEIPLPDLRGRREILQIHAQKVQLAGDVDLEQLARLTPLFSGADLAATVNEGAIIAAIGGRQTVTMENLRQARDKLRFGRAKTSRQRDQQQRLVSAYHEAGHALLQVKLEDADPIEKVTIIPRGRAQGGTFSFPARERYGYSRKYLLATMRVICGGRIAERKKTGDMTTGAEDDIGKLTQMADHMARRWGMSESLGFVRLSRSGAGGQWLVPQRNYSEATAAEIDKEVRRLIDQAYADAEQLIDENWSQVEVIAEALLDRETLAAADVDRLLRGGDLPASTPENEAGSTSALTP